MTRTIPHRELRNNSSSVLREVAHGETIAVTNRGEVVAILVPPADDRDGLRVRKATESGGFATLPRLQLEHSVQDSVDDLRGER